MIEPIDLTSLIPPQLAAFPSAVQAAIPDIAEAVRTRIIDLAHNKLKSTEQDYVQGVQPVQYHFPSGRVPLTGSVTVASIALVGWLPNAVEHGWNGGDLIDALLAGRSARQGEKGPWTVVPFRHGSSRVTGRNMPAMGSQHRRLGLMAEDKAAKMGRSIHRAAKALTAHGAARAPGQAPRRLDEGMSGHLRPHHSTDIHAGMIRSEKTYKSKTENQFFTFRTVSRASKGKWIHPGIEPQNLFSAGGTYAGEIAGTLFASALRGAEKAGS